MWRVLRSRLRGDRGASAVEFALIMPLFVMLVFGIVAFGIIFAQKLALGNSARQAARYAVVQERTCHEITNEVRSAAAGTINMNTANIQVSVMRVNGATETSACSSPTATNRPCEGAPEGTSIKVSTTYASEVMIPLAVMNNTVTIDGEGVFRCEFV